MENESSTMYAKLFDGGHYITRKPIILNLQSQFQAACIIFGITLFNVNIPLKDIVVFLKTVEKTTSIK